MSTTILRASESPLWSGPTPKAVQAAGGTYGTLIATPGARGSWVLHHDPKEVYFVTVLYQRREPPMTIEIDGREFEVVRG